MMKEATRTKLINDLHEFLINTSIPGSILTTRIIKKRIRALNLDHTLKQSYIAYLTVRGNTEELSILDFDKIVNFIKYLPGFYQTTDHKRRVGTGVKVTHVIVKQNKVKI